MLTINRPYIALTVSLFLIETLIALYIHDGFVRPYLGDVLVVILIYCFLKSFLKIPVLPTAVFVLVFSFSIEFLQYFELVKLLHLENSKVARTVIGSSFEWLDLVAYISGFLFIIIAEKLIQKKA